MKLQNALPKADVPAAEARLGPTEAEPRPCFCQVGWKVSAAASVGADRCPQDTSTPPDSPRSGHWVSGKERQRIAGYL